MDRDVKYSTTPECSGQVKPIGTKILNSLPYGTFRHDRCQAQITREPYPSTHASRSPVEEHGSVQGWSGVLLHLQVLSLRSGSRLWLNARTYWSFEAANYQMTLLENSLLPLSLTLMDQLWKGRHCTNAFGASCLNTCISYLSSTEYPSNKSCLQQAESLHSQPHAQSLGRCPGASMRAIFCHVY